MYAEATAPVTLHSVLRHLPAIRSYLPYSDCGSINTLPRYPYEKQCYFITHIIYIFSDYGQHTLNRQVFEAEFKFIMSNLYDVEYLKDPDLLGEFVHCLYILQVRSGASVYFLCSLHVFF